MVTAADSYIHYIVTDMPELVLLPARVVDDLRLVADYLVKAPGENQTGIITICEVVYLT